jgi:septum site-determining protein MinC
LSAVDGVLIVALDPKVPFELLRRSIRETFSQTPDRFRGFDARLDMSSRSIDLFDLRRLVHLLRDEFGVRVAGLYCTTDNIQRFAERELKLKIYTRRPTSARAEEERAAKAAAEASAAESEPRRAASQSARRAPLADGVNGPARVKTIPRSMRSGQKIRFDGDVILFGDVNPGAEIIASGNILILGALKGLAHAGARGDDAAVIVSFDFRPTQLRIGRKIAMPPGETHGGVPGGAASRIKSGLFGRSVRPFTPEVAWVQGDQIVIEPYSGRLPRPQEI